MPVSPLEYLRHVLDETEYLIERNRDSAKISSCRMPRSNARSCEASKSSEKR